MKLTRFTPFWTCAMAVELGMLALQSVDCVYKFSARGVEEATMRGESVVAGSRGGELRWQW